MNGATAMLAATVAGVFTASMNAQAPSSRSQTPTAPRAYVQPRTPDGQPDIRGFWQVVPFGTYSLEDMSLQNQGGANFTTPAPGGTRIIDPPNGKIPYQPWAAARAKEILENHKDPKPHQLDPQSRCWLQGVPRGLANSESHILQTPGQVVLLHEYSHSYRVIPLDDRPRLPEQVKLFMGESRGRWEDRTLVIDTTNLNDIPWFDLVGSFHSDALHVTERLTRIGDETMEYRVTIDDQKMYTRPWTLGYTMKRNTDSTWEQMEHACFEGQRSLDHLLTRPAR
jgi:hypothetical protein